MFQNCISIKCIRANEMKNIIVIAIFIWIGQIYRYDKDSLPFNFNRSLHYVIIVE